MPGLEYSDWLRRSEAYKGGPIGADGKAIMRALVDITNEPVLFTVTTPDDVDADSLRERIDALSKGITHETIVMDSAAGTEPPK